MTGAALVNDALVNDALVDFAGVSPRRQTIGSLFSFAAFWCQFDKAEQR